MASPSDRLKSLEKAIQLQRAKIQGLYDAYLYGDAEQEEKKLSLLEKQYATEKKQDLDSFIAEWTEEIDRQRQEQREQEILDLYNQYVPLNEETVDSGGKEGYTGNGETLREEAGTFSTADAPLWYSPDYGLPIGTDSEKAEAAFSAALRQVVLGNYTDDVTLLGTAMQIAMSLTGADTAMDIRDLAYDITHWKWDKGHILQTVLDAVGLIPGIGVVKNLDEAGTVLKALFNGAETLTPALAAAAKTGPEAAEWLMKGIARYGDTVTELLRGTAKNADDAAGLGLLVSAVRKAEDSGDLLKSADEAIGTAQSAAKSADEIIENAGKVNFDSKKLLNSGNQLDKGGELTKAGRALEKHGSRYGSIYPQATGNVTNKNALGNQILESILNNPNATSVTRYHAMYGDILEIKISGGMGARFSADGSTFIGFLE
ncbi:hypothetical protein [Papillibacter cinnamivorans]|nr:hypothetical protein [Papillibacter cinnamivorans]